MAGTQAADRSTKMGGGADDVAAAAPHYFAFISYSHADETWAQWLHKALETYRVPSRLAGLTTQAGVIPRRLIPVFRDRDELASATDLGRTVNAALAQSANLIVICSPNSATSRWVNEEVLAFKRLGNAERIFCLIVGGEPNATEIPGRQAEEWFAPALRYTLGADGQPTQQRTEPIAADARKGKDGKPNAKLKLIAGMLDVGFDALKQRELQRRNWRMAAITAVALIIMAITTTLAITAVIARHDAERRQKQAEDLVDFMLGNLTDKLREVQRLDILQVVDDKAMAYFASLPTKDVTDTALALRVEALEKIGSVRQDQGQMPAAVESYSAASVLAKELLKRSPDDIARQAGYADSLTWIGMAHWYQGDLEKAAANFRVASERLRAAVAAKPADPDLAKKLTYALTNAGRVLEMRGEFDKARPYYADVLKTLETLVSREPANAELQALLGDSYNNLGKLSLEQGHLDQAVAAYRADQRIKARLAAADRNNHTAQENLAISNAFLGRTLDLCGEPKTAQHYLGASVEGLEKLMKFDPAQVDWQYLFARYSEQLASAEREQGHFESASRENTEAIRLLEALVAKDPTRIEWEQQLARNQVESARLALGRDDPDSAESHLGPARETIERLRTKTPDDRNLILLSAQTDIVVGEVAARRHENTASQASWSHARDTIASAAKSGSDLNFLATWATALLLLGDTQNAAPAVSKLASSGYRTLDLASVVANAGVPFPVNTDVARRIADIMEEDSK